MSTTDVSKVGVHTCKQRAYMNTQSPQVLFDQEYTVTITCVVATYAKTNTAWNALYRHYYGQATWYLAASYLATPDGCYTETFTGLQANGSALPSSITVD